MVLVRLYKDMKTKRQKLHPIPAEIFFSRSFQALSLENKRRMLNNEAILRLPKKEQVGAKRDQRREDAARKKREIKESQYVERGKVIERLRNEGKTLEQIGAIIGVSRERIRQIEGTRLNLIPRSQIKKPVFTRDCKNPKCTNQVTYQPSNRNPLYCSRECRFSMFPKKTIEEKRAMWNMRTKRYYHNVFKKRPDFSKIVSRNNHKYWNKKKKKEAKIKQILKLTFK